MSTTARLAARFDQRVFTIPKLQEREVESPPVYSEEFDIQIRADYTHMRVVDMRAKYGTTKKQMELWINHAFRGRP